jgi:hypothetical protein
MPPWGRRYGALTLWPFIFLRPGWSASLCRHELVHWRQVREAGWLRFYAAYVWEWRLGVRWLGGTPYRELAAEREARAHEADATYLPPDLESLVRSDGTNV